MGLTKRYWMQQEELQPMYEWIEEHFGILDEDEDPDAWDEAVNAFHEYLEYMEYQEDYYHAAEEYRYYILQTLGEADDKFSSDCSELSALVEMSDNKPILYKMAFAHAVTLFEVYMENIAKLLVTRSDKFLMSFLRNSNAVASKTYSLKDLLVNRERLEKEIEPKEIRIKALSVLSNVLYHDIDKVINIFESIIGEDFKFEKKGLKRVFHIRHDIVHRNGINKEGEAHRFSQAVVLEAISELISGAEEIRSSVGTLPR